MEFRNDGTIVIEFPRRRPVEHEDGPVTWESTDEVEKVKLRRPILDELLELWEAVDRLSGAPVQGSIDVDGVDDAPMIKSAVVNLRRNALWIRLAVQRLGTPDVYEEAEDGTLKIRSDLAEPAWFSSATAAGQMLRQWQDVPSAPGSALTR